jgi:hypothetical protein
MAKELVPTAIPMPKQTPRKIVHLPPPLALFFTPPPQQPPNPLNALHLKPMHILALALAHFTS